MRIINLIVIVGATVALSVSAFGQGAPRGGGQGGGRMMMGGGGPGGGREGMMKRQAEWQKEIFAKIHTTKAQEAKIKALNAKSGKEMKALMDSAMKGGGRPGPEMMDKFRSMREKEQKALAGILTKDQMKKYQELMKAKRDELRKKSPGMGGPGMGGPGMGRGK